MSTQGLNNDNYELISRYLSGNASDAEVQKLEQWVLASSENKEEFIEFKKAWLLGGMSTNAQRTDIESNWQKISKQLFSSTKVIPLKASRRIWLRIAAAIALIVSVSLWFYFNNSKPLDPTVGTVRSINLPDGSLVILNHSSSLETVEMDENIRKLTLEGDAFFEVTKDEERPFIIQTSEVEVEVLGTSFYVDSRMNQSEIQVIVESGTVAVRNAAAEVVLQANQKAVFDKNTGTLVQGPNEDINYLSLKTDTLIFDNTRLEEVAFVLNRHFDKAIIIETSQLKNCVLTATFRNKSLESIIEVIQKSLKIKVRQTPNKIIFSGTSCE